MNVIFKTINNSYSKRIIDTVLPIQLPELGVAITLDDQLDLLNIEDYCTVDNVFYHLAI